jgi:hypothetical protein
MAGIGDGEGVGSVIGGCPDTTGGGTGETGGAMVTGGCPDVVGPFSAGSDLADTGDGPIGFELLLQAATSGESTTVSTIDES